jgi:hypothetical protein
MAPSTYQASLSEEGYTYTKRDGLVRGLRTYGVIQPERTVQQTSNEEIWDAVVIGAGYAGLVAARDLVKAGKSLIDERGSMRKSLKTGTQARKSFYLKPATESAAGPGARRLRAPPSRWVVHGFRTSTVVSLRRWSATDSKTMSA